MTWVTGLWEVGIASVSLIVLYAVAFTWRRYGHGIFWMSFALLTICVTCPVVLRYAGEAAAGIMLCTGVLSIIIFYVSGLKGVLKRTQRQPDPPVSRATFILSLTGLLVAAPAMYFVLQDPAFSDKLAALSLSPPISLPLLMLMVSIPMCSFSITLALAQRRHRPVSPKISSVSPVTLGLLCGGAAGVFGVVPIEYYFIHTRVFGVLLVGYLVLLVVGLMLVRKQWVVASRLNRP